LPDQKIRLTDPLSLLRRSRQKSAAAAETMHSESSRFHAHRFTFGGVIAERVYTVETHHKVFPVFVCSLASSRIKMCSIIVHAHVRIYISSINATFCTAPALVPLTRDTNRHLRAAHHTRRQREPPKHRYVDGKSSAGKWISEPASPSDPSSAHRCPQTNDSANCIYALYCEVLFHGLLLRCSFYHCVWSVITAHNRTPEKRDNNYSAHPVTPTMCLRSIFKL